LRTLFYGIGKEASVATSHERVTNARQHPAAPSTSLWRNRDYLLFWSGQSLSDIGGAISELAYPLLVLSISHSPAAAGLVAALRALPGALFGLFAGVLVDRWDRRQVMLTCDALRALCLLSIPLAYALGHLSIAQLAGAAFVEGTLLTVFRLAKTAAVPQLVTPSQLPTAVAQEEFVEGTTTLVGPALSGFLYTLGAMLPFLTDAVSYLISLTTLALMRTPFQRTRTTKLRHIGAEIRAGLRWVWRQPFILTMTLMMGAGAFGFSGQALIIIILAERAQATAVVIGLIVAVGGIGSILGSLLTSRLGHFLTVGQSILVSRWFFVLSWALYALAPFPPVLAAVEFGTGFMDPIEDIPYFSHRLQLIPEELRGRVISVCRLLPATLRPLGLALTGILIQRLGMFPTIWLIWAWLLAATILVTIVPTVRRER
jgi:MFS family permease